MRSRTTCTLYLTQPRTATNAAGCTPGYWRNHLDRWPIPNQNFETALGVPAGSINWRAANCYPNNQVPTLSYVLANNRDCGVFAYHAAAAILNVNKNTPDQYGMLAWAVACTCFACLIRLTHLNSPDSEKAGFSLICMPFPNALSGCARLICACLACSSHRNPRW